MPADLYLGIPDRLVLLPDGRMFFIELKTAIGHLSKPQVNYWIRLKRLGYNYFVLRGISELNLFIKEHIRVL